MTLHSSLTLGSALANAPKRLSKKGYEEMFHDSHLEALREQSLKMLDMVLEAHGSTANAHRIGHADYDAYKAAERAYSVARSQHVKTTFARELKEFFEQSRSSSYGQADHAKGSTEERLDDAVQVDPGEGTSNTFDKMTTPDFSSEHATAITNNDLSMIDPQLFDSLDEGLQDILVEAVASDPSLAANMDTVPIVSDGSLTQIRQTKRSKTVTMAITVLDSVSEVLLQNDVVLTDSELSDLMVTSFSNMFPSDNFFPGHEPLPGTTTCRFCDKDLLSSNKTRAVHTYWCAKKSLSEEIIGAVDSECIVPETCSWVGSGPRTQGKVCGAVIADSAASHLLSHSKVGVECRFGGCGQTEQAVLFKGNAELVTHIFKEHKILCTNAVGHRRAEMFVWWCSSCLAWIDGVKEDLNQHANSHIPLINDIIHHEGYTGLTVYDINFRPIFCPFCLHDETLPETIRFKDFCCTGRAGYVKHVLAHLKALDDGGAACPAAKSSADGILCNCSSVEPMNAKELQDHLNQRHELDLSADERTSNKVVAIDSSGPPMKKRKTGNTGRRIHWNRSR